MYILYQCNSSKELLQVDTDRVIQIKTIKKARWHLQGCNIAALIKRHVSIAGQDLEGWGRGGCTSVIGGSLRASHRSLNKH